jgi:TonB family protein
LLLALGAPLARAQQPRAADPHGTTPPVVVKHVDAVYPESAKAARTHANVVLTVTIDKEGHVSKVDVAASGGPDIDQSAVVAVKQWTFKPATRAGQPVAVKIRIPFHFAPPGESEGEDEPGKTPDAPPASPHFDRVEERKNVGGGPGAGETDETVTVQGRALPPSRGGSDYHVHVGELRHVPRQNAAELLKLAPGVLLTNEGGEGHAQQVFMRGFDAREGQDIEFSVGGVPVNESGNLHANGYADTHFIIPELVRSVRIVEGPFDPRQGNYAVAGSADYELGLDKRGLTMKYTHGSYASNRLLLTWGPSRETAHTFGGAELYGTSGFGQNRDARRASAMGQYEGKLGERGSWRITSQAYAVDYHSAGALRDDDYRYQTKGFYDTYDFGQGGQSSRYSLAADVESKTGKTTLHQQLFLIHRGMRVRENFTGFLLDVQRPQQTPHGQRGDLIDRDISSTTLGGRGFARARDTILSELQEAELGYFARYDKTDATQHRIENATNVPYALDADLGAKLGDLGLYGDLNVKPLSWVTVRGGARADFFTYDVLDRCAQKEASRPSRDNPPGDASCLSQQDFGRYREPVQRTSTASTALMPRASLLFGPFASFTLSAGYGQGVRAIDPLFVNQDVATPFVRVDAYEGGATYSWSTPSTSVVAKSIFFATHVDRDLIFNESAGRSTLASGTTRTGWVGSVRASGAFFDQSANLTLVRSSFDDTHLLVPYVPDVVLRSDTALFADLPFRIDGEKVRGTLGLGLTYVGRRALPFGQRSGRIFTLDTSIGASWRMFELSLNATNLFDARYRLGEYNYASDYHTSPQPTLVPVRHFTAGAPRMFFLSLAVTIGG